MCIRLRINKINLNSNRAKNHPSVSTFSYLKGGQYVDVQGPGHVFLPFLVMEDLLDKLKLLDYDIQFVSELKMRPLNRHYFVIQTNPGEQFFMFR